MTRTTSTAAERHLRPDRLRRLHRGARAQSAADRAGSVDVAKADRSPARCASSCRSFPESSRRVRSRRSSLSPTRICICRCSSRRSSLLLIFQHLTVALLRSEHRAEQLEARSRQLVGLQLGVLRTLVQSADDARPHHRAARLRGGPLLRSAGEGDRLHRGRTGSHAHRRRCCTTSASSPGRTACCMRR